MAEHEESSWLDGIKGLFVETVGEKSQHSSAEQPADSVPLAKNAASADPVGAAPSAEDQRMGAELMRNVLSNKTPFNALVAALDTLQQVPDMNERTRYQAAFAMLKATMTCTPQGIVDAFDVHAANLVAERRKFEEVSAEQETSLIAEKNKQIADWKSKAEQAQRRAEALRAEIASLQKQESEASSKVAVLEAGIAADKRQIGLIKQRFERALEHVQEMLQAHREKVRQYLN